MKTLKVLTLTIFCVLAFAAVASAQAGGKIAVINTEAFRDEKTGITKYVNAMKTLETEFAPAQTELRTMAARIQTIEKEVKLITDARQKGTPVDEKSLQNKQEEYEKLVRDYRFKEEDAKTRFQRRLNAVTDPLNQAIGAALDAYGKQKGYMIIFDIARNETGLIVAIPDEKIDITKDFIAFYNARP